ncbi:MAG: C40 family peptidase [Bacteroidales bacterium]|nr:C40 family peptidase [Bacteroidales bacterium]
MEYGICLHSVVPVRAEPSHKSEMVSQVLFGELYLVTEKEESWCRIRQLFDNYEGWIDILQVHCIGDQEFLRLSVSETYITMDLIQLLSHENDMSMIPVVIGSSLPALEASRLRIGQDVYLYEGTVSGAILHETKRSNQDVMQLKQQLIEGTRLYLNAPYLWGGRTPMGIDCSGLIQMVFKLQGFHLMRDASQQATQGEVISLLGEAEPCDLVFFDDVEEKITHVGMLLDRYNVVHCSGHVRVDTIDHEGIYNAKLQKYTHKLRLIKRVI